MQQRSVRTALLVVAFVIGSAAVPVALVASSKDSSNRFPETGAFIVGAGPMQQECPKGCARSAAARSFHEHAFLISGSPMDDQLRHYKAKLDNEIDPWDLNEALGRGDKILLVDTRSPEAYRRSHIPGAISIPHRTMGTATTAHLDKGALIVTSVMGSVVTVRQKAR